MIDFRKANAADVDLYFKWTNDPLVRENSYSQEPISYEQHLSWFESKIKSGNTLMLVFFVKETGDPIGQVRFENQEGTAIIGVSIDDQQRGKGFASEMLNMASLYYNDLYHPLSIDAYIKENNSASINAFLKAGFGNQRNILYNNIKSVKLSFND